MTTSTSTTTRTPKALLLDDDTTVLRLLGTALQDRGFDVRAATDGDAGTALLVDELLDLDVLVVDADLPGRDARALLHLVRWAGGERDLGVVVLASGLDAAARAELAALGADAVVDRRAGHDAAARAIVAVARGASPTRRPVRAARPALAGALVPALPLPRGAGLWRGLALADTLAPSRLLAAAA
jgi:DNA-binding response OmpR family regulator